MMMASLRSYLMANEVPLTQEKGAIKKATSLFRPFRKK